MPDSAGIRILVVEDEKKLAGAIVRGLERAGYQADVAHDGDVAIEKATASEFGLILLDLNLPGKSGFEVLRELRSRLYDTPVLILSARDAVDDRIEGLHIGADDYMVKPFDTSELLARIEAILRRSGVHRISVLQAADLTMDVVARTVSRGDTPLHLSPREFSLLEYMLRNKNQVLTRRRLAEQVWGYTFDTGTNIVDVYVSYLRRAIDHGREPKLIQTVLREGFVLSDA
jgi:DNA-binding response OmpR family regulator